MEKSLLIEFFKAHSEGGIGARIIYDNPSYGETVLTVKTTPIFGEDSISFIDAKGEARSVDYASIRKVMP